jgi:hypothetical protein
VLTTDEGPRGNQPFHRAKELGIDEANGFLASYTAETDRLAAHEIAGVIRDLQSRNLEVCAAGLLLSSGGSLPALAQILGSHPLIHSAEGELFRNSVRRACESFNMPVEGIRKRDLRDDAIRGFPELTQNAIGRIARSAKALGPPWTAEHKTAAFAAYFALRRRRKNAVGVS